MFRVYLGREMAGGGGGGGGGGGDFASTLFMRYSVNC